MAVAEKPRSASQLDRIALSAFAGLARRLGRNLFLSPQFRSAKGALRSAGNRMRLRCDDSYAIGIMST